MYCFAVSNSVLQSVAMYCSESQCVAVCCSMSHLPSMSVVCQKQTATYCNSNCQSLGMGHQAFMPSLHKKELSLKLSFASKKRRCNTLPHTATHCNTLQHMHTHPMHSETLTAKHCNTLQHTATHCNTLQRTATHCNAQQNNPGVCLQPAS